MEFLELNFSTGKLFVNTEHIVSVKYNNGSEITSLESSVVIETTKNLFTLRGDEADAILQLMVQE